jgi:hypothetical protein
MWQFEWMIGLLPDWVFHTLIAVGVGMIVASWVLKHIPFINQYNFPIYMLGTTLTIGAIWFSGVRVGQSANSLILG